MCVALARFPAPQHRIGKMEIIRVALPGRGEEVRCMARCMREARGVRRGWWRARAVGGDKREEAVAAGWKWVVDGGEEGGGGRELCAVQHAL